jgi:CRP/FNR family cyclic AMP-dependent transcriptional regulator
LIEKLGPGEILGEISGIDKLKTTASVQAIEPVDCLFLSEWDFTVQMDAYPPIALGLLKVLVQRFRLLYEKIK